MIAWVTFAMASSEVCLDRSTVPEGTEVHLDHRRGGLVPPPKGAQAWGACAHRRLAPSDLDVLASNPPTILALPRVSTLGPAAGERLARLPTSDLRLTSLDDVPVAFARAWAAAGEGRHLALGAPDDIEVVRWLGHPNTERLELGWEDPAPQLLAHLHNQEVALPALRVLRAETVAALREATFWRFPAVRTLEPGVAAELTVLHVELGLTKLDAELARSLPEHVDLPALVQVETEVLGVIASKSLTLGLVELSSEQASALRCRRLALPDLQALSVESAQALAENPALRDLELPALTELSEDAATALSRGPSRDDGWVVAPSLHAPGERAMALLVDRFGRLDLSRSTGVDRILGEVPAGVRQLTLPPVDDVRALHAYTGSLTVHGVPKGLGALEVSALEVELGASDPLDGLSEVTDRRLRVRFPPGRRITEDEARILVEARPEQVESTSSPATLAAAKALLPLSRALPYDLPIREQAAGVTIADRAGAPCLPDTPGWHDHTAGLDGIPQRTTVPWVQCGLEHLDATTAERLLPGRNPLVLPHLVSLDPDAWALLIEKRQGPIVLHTDTVRPAHIEWLRVPARTEVALYGLRDLTPTTAASLPRGAHLVFPEGLTEPVARALPPDSSVFSERPLSIQVLRVLDDRRVQSRQLKARRAELRPPRPRGMPATALWLSDVGGVLAPGLRRRTRIATPADRPVLTVDVGGLSFEVPWTPDRPRYDDAGLDPTPIEVALPPGDPIWSKRGVYALQLHSVRLAGDRSSAWATLYRRAEATSSHALVPGHQQILGRDVEVEHLGEVWKVVVADQHRQLTDRYRPCIRDLCFRLEDGGPVVEVHALEPVEESAR